MTLITETKDGLLTYGLGIAKHIDDLYYSDEATIGIVYGGYMGTGKSTYCFKAMAEVYGSHPGWPDNKPNYEAIKENIVFPPKQFCDRILAIKQREKVICWDDMGLWMFALDWHDPFIKWVIKYFNVMRSDLAMMLGNTPTPKMIVGKVQSFPESIRIKISKQGSNQKNPKRPRLAQSYRLWYSPDLRKSGVTTKGMWLDQYSAMLPNDFYQWYKPRRDKYAQLAKLMMVKELDGLKKKEEEKQKEHLYEEEILPIPERISELEEITANLNFTEQKRKKKNIKDPYEL